MKIWHWVTAVSLVISMAGCAAKEEPAPPQTPAHTASAETGVAAFSADPSQAGQLTGVVRYAGSQTVQPTLPVRGNPECSIYHEGGEAPNEELLVSSGMLQNAFVYVKTGLEDKRFAPPAQAVEIDNKNCLYSPHVTGAMVDQPILLVNSDPTLHNVHAYSKNSKSWNIGLPVQGMKVTKKFSNPEVMVALKCDVHPWMQGYLGVLPHPYFAVTDASGAFTLKDVPAGKYTLEVWHEKLGTQSQEITIGPLENKQIEFTYS